METNSKENKILEMALHYYDVKKWCVIPVGKDKKTLLNSWREYQNERPTREQVINWWTKYPDANIAVITGSISGIGVVDIDLDKETKKLAPEMEDVIKKLPVTLTATTGSGGKHYFYKLTQPINSSNRIINFVDIRGEGGYIILPPSIHLSGNQYSFDNDNEMVEFPYAFFKEASTNEKRKLEKKDYNRLITEGERNAILTSYIGKLIHDHKEEEWLSYCLPTALAFNQAKCSPPLSEDEVVSIFQSICKKHKKNQVVKTVLVAENKGEIMDTSNSTIIQINKPEKEVTLAEWRNVISSNFPDCLFPAEVAMSIVAQLLIKDITNPFALVLVGPPSSGKTITINFFANIPEVTYSTDNFTPQSFVSHAANVSKEKLNEIDLLPGIKNKMMLVRELAPLFGQRDDDLLKSMGILTRVLDGEGLETNSGVHGKRGYTGEYLFMWLAGSTPIQPKVWKLMGNLGSRLFFLNVHSRDKSEDELSNQLINNPYKEKEKICSEMTKNLIYTFWNKYKNSVAWDKKKENPQYLSIIARCAILLSKLRGTINVYRDRYSDSQELIHTIPVIEKPDRINQLFYNLCRGHALINGRNKVEKEDLKLPLEIAFDSAPTTRARLFRKLLEYNGQMKTTDVEKELNCSKPTAINEMEALKILGVVSISEGDYGEKAITLSEKLNWFLSDECNELRGVVELSSDTTNQLSKSDAVLDGKQNIDGTPNDGEPKSRRRGV